MLLTVLKSAVRVKPYVRDHHPIHGYVQRRHDKLATRQPYTAEMRVRMAANYRLVERMAIGTVASFIGQGKLIQFPDEAVMNGVEAGMNAVARQIPPERIRRRVKSAVRQYMDWEKTHGVTGLAALMQDFYKRPAERDALLHFLPKAEPVEIAEAMPAPSPEDEALRAGEIRSREAALAEVEQRYQVNLDKVRAMLEKRRPGVRGRMAGAVDRDIRMFEDRLRGFSFYEIGEKYGVSHTHARNTYNNLLAKMREVVTAERREQGEAPVIQAWEAGKVTKALRLGDVRQDRLLQAFSRHYLAIQDGFPVEFVDNSRYLLTNLLLEEETA